MESGGDERPEAQGSLRISRGSRGWWGVPLIVGQLCGCFPAARFRTTDFSFQSQRCRGNGHAWMGFQATPRIAGGGMTGYRVKTNMRSKLETGRRFEVGWRTARWKGSHLIRWLDVPGTRTGASGRKLKCVTAGRAYSAVTATAGDHRGDPNGVRAQVEEKTDYVDSAFRPWEKRQVGWIYIQGIFAVRPTIQQGRCFSGEVAAAACGRFKSPLRDRGRLLHLNESPCQLCDRRQGGPWRAPCTDGFKARWLF